MGVFIYLDQKPVMNAHLEHGLLRKELCSSVMELNENITASALVDENGRVEEIEMREGVIASLSASRRAELFKYTVMRHKTARIFEKDSGPEIYALSKRDKSILISFPINSRLLIVECQPYLDTYHLCKKILKLIHQK